MNPVPLTEIPFGTDATVVKVSCARGVACRLMEMGLLPGTRLQVRRVAPLGDPIELSIRGYALSVRNSEARHILVEPIGA